MIKGKMIDKSVLFLLAIEEKRDVDTVVREHLFLKKYDVMYKVMCEREEREFSSVVSSCNFR